MEPSEILKRIERRTGRFEQEAVEAALADPQAVIPELLHVLESVASDPGRFANDSDYMAHLYVM